MIDRKQIWERLSTKVLPSVDRVAKDAGDDHDIFPTLLWLLLTSEERIQQLVDELRSTSDRQSAQLNENRIADSELIKNAINAFVSDSKASEAKLTEYASRLGSHLNEQKSM